MNTIFKTDELDLGFINEEAELVREQIYLESLCQ
jgi:hypothetical protein